MKVLFIGTGAADWDLGTRVGDEFFRRLTAVKINDDFMIDCSADTADFINHNSGALDAVGNVIITHTHSDHYSPVAITSLLKKDVRVWAEPEAEKMILRDMPHLTESKLTIFKENSVGGYTVIPVPANHSVNDERQTPLSYIISHGDKTIFWGCDGAWIPNRSWHEMKKHRYDLIVLDGTLGEENGDYRIFEHNNLAMVKEIAYVIHSQKLLKQNGRIFISHISRYSHKSHEELCRQLANVNVEVAFDGLEIEL